MSTIAQKKIGNINRLKPVLPVQLQGLVSQQLSQWILDEGLAPGDSLPSERELCRQLGVARSVVREAIVHLQALGIVDTYQGRGTFVSEQPILLLVERIQRLQHTSQDHLQEIWEVREMLEVQIAALAAVRRTEEDLRRLHDAIKQMDQAIRQGESCIAEDAQFHVYLTIAAKNVVLEQLVAGIGTLISKSRYHSLARPGRAKTSNEEHKLILEAVRAADKAGAREAMRLHLAHGRHLTTGESLDD